MQASFAEPTCRFCATELRRTFVDLGSSPLCQTQIAPENLDKMEPFFPLHTHVCDACHLVQLGEYVAPDEIFSSAYPYFSSYSTSWVEHARLYAEMMRERFGFDASSLVVEIASNDGYLLQHFHKANVPVLGIEPAGKCAEAARAKNIDTISRFFGRETANEVAGTRGQADLLLGNNVLAHVPDLNDFVAGMKILLAPNGIITMEFPHLLRLIEQNQFDTIYHEHFSYFWFQTAEKVFQHHGLTLFDVEELPTHGGSLRIFGRHQEDDSKPVTDRVGMLRHAESLAGWDRAETYDAFEERVRDTKRSILEFLIKAKRERKTVVGYGAPGKGNTLLNYCGIRTDFLDYTVDRSPHKQGTYTPGTRIPILDPEIIRETKPDYVFILPWNLKTEITEQMSYIRDWGGRFVVPIPEPRVL